MSYKDITKTLVLYKNLYLHDPSRFSANEIKRTIWDMFNVLMDVKGWKITSNPDSANSLLGSISNTMNSLQGKRNEEKGSSFVETHYGCG